MSDVDSNGTERLRPQCFNPNCDESFESVNEMVAVLGRGGRSPRHFCEGCAEKIRRGPPMTDGGQPQDGTERCEWCNTPLWEHEKPFGSCQSCRNKKRELDRPVNSGTDRSEDGDEL